MRCKSFSTLTPNAYRAGFEIGAALNDIEPEVVILFASINYSGRIAAIFEGLQEGLGKQTILFGGTGDGIYETKRVAHYGVAALGLNSGGKLKWCVNIEGGVDKNSAIATKSCIEQAIKKIETDPSFCFLLADGVKADGSAIAASANILLSIPFFGGLVGDDRKFEHSYIFINGVAYQNSVAVLLASGKIETVINSASGWTPTGEIGLIESCYGSVIRTISGQSAQDFIRSQSGKSLGEVDLGIVPLAVSHKGREMQPFLRTPSSLDPLSGEITMFGSLVSGDLVRICTAKKEDIVRGVKDALSLHLSANFRPTAAIIVSCAGRKWILEDDISAEVNAVFETLGKEIPLIGFPSFGEIGPFQDNDGHYSESFFHNVTYIICLIGEDS